MQRCLVDSFLHNYVFFSYSSSESKRIHNMAAGKGVISAVKAEEEKLKSLSWEMNPPGTEKLR